MVIAKGMKRAELAGTWHPTTYSPMHGIVAIGSSRLQMREFSWRSGAFAIHNSISVAGRKKEGLVPNVLPSLASHLQGV